MSDNTLALRIDAVGDDLRLAHTRGVVMGTVMLRALADGGYRGATDCEAKLREFVSSSRRARTEAMALMDSMRSSLAYKQRVVEDVDSLVDQMTEALGIGDRTLDVSTRLDELFPLGADLEREDPSLPRCSVCSHRREHRVAFSCGHSFCAACVRRSVEATPGRTTCCFACRREPTSVIRLYF